MSVSEWVQKGWREHAEQTEAVFERLHEGVALVDGADDAGKVAGLIVHVAGEHLGRWDAGLALLDRILERQEAGSVWRSKAILHHCAGRIDERDAASARGRSEFSESSDQIRILALSASALIGQGGVDAAGEALSTALDLAGYGPDSEDPAARALAVAGNGIAATLEEREGRSAAEDDLLRTAAHAARRFWEIAGTWVNVERAEYRLAKTYVALGDGVRASAHAYACLAICADHDADAIELFFGREALAHALHVYGDPERAEEARDDAAASLQAIEGGMRDWCAGELAKLDATLADSR